MSTWINGTMNKGFIKYVFLQTCGDEAFQNCWLIVRTWAALAVSRYNLSETLKFSGEELVKIIYSKESQGWTSQMDVQKNITTDHIGVFHKKYRPKGGRIMFCFYATKPGGAPPVSQDTWCKHICCVSDLLRKLSTHTEK